MYAHALAFYDMNDNLKELAGAVARKAQLDRPRVLVGVDGSPGSMAAVEYARDLVAERGGDIRLVNVQPSPAVPDARRKGERVLASAMAILDAAKTPYRAEVAYGKRSEELLRSADRERCTMIVLGDSGRSAVVKFLVGAVSHRVIGKASVPVVLVSRTIRATTYMPAAGASPFAAAA